MTAVTGSMGMTAARCISVDRQHPIRRVGIHRSQFRLFLQVFQLWIRLYHAVLASMTRTTAFPFSHGSVVSVENGSEISATRRIGEAKVSKSSESGRDGVHLVDGVGSIPGRRVVRVWRGIGLRSHDGSVGS